MTFALAFPNIDPVIVEFGPVAIRWYALSYIAGLLIGWRWMMTMAKQAGGAITAEHVDDFFVWATLGVVLGGRVGYVLFYNFDYFMSDPVQIFKVWQGGMSFHGGLLGVIVATIWFTKSRAIKSLAFLDMLAAVTPVGLFFGRIANFINGELYGRVTYDVPWAVFFPTGGPEPRHPSQLYEAALEGLVLLVVTQVLWRNEKLRARPGLVAGVFILGYGLARAFVELFREPDAHLGFLAGGLTMGQWLSLPMWILGAVLVARALKMKPN